jgi:hypothetical protein
MKTSKMIIYLLIILTSWWYWLATTPPKAVGRLEVKLGPGWFEVVKIDIFGHILRLSYNTYTLHLTDGYGQHFNIDVSPTDFEKAEFNKYEAWDVSRIRRHYFIELTKSKQ